MMPLIQLTFVLALASMSAAVPIPNGVVGYPAVTCGEHSIGVVFNTEATFDGRVYVKGESERQECMWPQQGYAHQPKPDYGPAPPVTDYPQYTPYQAKAKVQRAKRQTYIPAHEYEQQKSIGDSVSIDVKFGQCNMRRQRTLSPRGVEYTFTVVISFHKLFLTKVDRAYRIKCFYMETTKTVNTAIDVSMLTTQAVNEQYPMPTCYYHLKRGYDGQYARYARVGEKIVHSWECDHRAAYVYSILVHSCYVDDGAGNKVQLVDKQGCAVDKYLLGDIQYDPKGISASVQTHVFKYADKSTLLFQCSIQLCFKNDGGCQGITPPQCGGYQPQHVPAPYQPQSQSNYQPPPQEHNSYSDPPPYQGRVISNHGPFLPPLSPVNPAAPYKDEPVPDDDQDAASKVKRSVDAAERDARLEADLVAPSLVVLPFDADEDNETELQRELSKVLPASVWTPSYGRDQGGMCISQASITILAVLFIGMFLFAAVLSFMIAKRSVSSLKL